jgi:hypothetical protein
MDAKTRVLLRSTENGRYFLDLDQWTPERWSARDFGTSGRAVLFAMDLHLANVEVVLAFEDPRYDVAMPLSQQLGRAPEAASGRERPEAF